MDFIRRGQEYVGGFMKAKTFFIIFAAVLTACAGLTAAHLIYDYNAYQHSSIIYFIAEEMW